MLILSKKGDNTRQLIRTEAYKLFAQKGYKDVTMTNICESTGLSRGGLYRHYGSTEEIFLEIITSLLNNQENEFIEKMEIGISASEILHHVLNRYEEEMIDSENSLSIAIYEFYSNPQIAKSENSIVRQYNTSKKMWTELIAYGIQKGEFKPVDPEAVFDLIVFSYQGVRMYSRIMPIDPIIPERIVKQIKTLLLVKGEEK